MAPTARGFARRGNIGQLMTAELPVLLHSKSVSDLIVAPSKGNVTSSGRIVALKLGQDGLKPPSNLDDPEPCEPEIAGSQGLGVDAETPPVDRPESQASADQVDEREQSLDGIEPLISEALGQDINRALDLARALSEIQIEHPSVILVKRLSDLLLLPDDQMTPLARSLVDEILVRLVDHVEPELRSKLAHRIAKMMDPPAQLLNRLVLDEITVAQPILELNTEISSSDLIEVVRRGNKAHRLTVAKRRHLESSVADALIDWGETEVIETLLKNAHSRLSFSAMERLVARSRYVKSLQGLLVKREDLHISLAVIMFWWLPQKLRARVLFRFHISRRVLQQSVQDAVASGEIDLQTYDPVQREALDFILSLRRRSANKPLDVRDKLKRGKLDAFLIALTEAASISRQTLIKILRDDGGEPLAVLCKAANVTRQDFELIFQLLWQAQNREQDILENLPRLGQVYDALPLDSAEIIVRYWNRPRIDIEKSAEALNILD